MGARPVARSRKSALRGRGLTLALQTRKPRLREVKPLAKVPSTVGSAPRPPTQARGTPGVCWPPPGLPPSLPAHVRLTATASPLPGPAPSKEAGTQARFPLSDAVEEGAWTAEVVGQQDSALSLQLSTPPNAPIGLYRLSLEASTGYQGSSFVLGHFFLLFNPWCPGEPYDPSAGCGDGQGRAHPRGPLRVGAVGQKRHQSRLSETPSAPCRAPASPKPCDVSTLIIIPTYGGRDRHSDTK